MLVKENSDPVSESSPFSPFRSFLLFRRKDLTLFHGHVRFGSVVKNNRLPFLPLVFTFKFRIRGWAFFGQRDNLSRCQLCGAQKLVLFNILLTILSFSSLNLKNLNGVNFSIDNRETWVHDINRWTKDSILHTPNIHWVWAGALVRPEKTPSSFRRESPMFSNLFFRSEGCGFQRLPVVQRTIDPYPSA